MKVRGILVRKIGMLSRITDIWNMIAMEMVMIDEALWVVIHGRGRQVGGGMHQRMCTGERLN